MSKLNDYKLRLWSVSVRRRDKRCQICGSYQRLQAHHINSKSYFPEEAYDQKNGITLCATDRKTNAAGEPLKFPGNSCHIRFHTRWMNSTREKCDVRDLERFMWLIQWAQGIHYRPED